MLVPWLIVKSVLTLSVLGLIAAGSYLITTHHPPPPQAATVLTIVESSTTCNRTDCSGKGECEVQGALENASRYICLCDELNYGPLCEEECSLLCSGVGTCKTFNDTTNLTSMFLDPSGNVSCKCPHNYAGAGCEVKCNCSSNGVCREDGSCLCERGFGGEGCEVSCDGDCGGGWCTEAGTCQCDPMHYGVQCESLRKMCHTIENITVQDNSAPAEQFARYEGGVIGEEYSLGSFPDECAMNSSITYYFIFPRTTRCVGIVRVFNATNTFLAEYSQDGASVFPENASEGVINFDARADNPFLIIRSHFAPGLPQEFELTAFCNNTRDTSCPRLLITKEPCIVTEYQPGDQSEHIITSVLYNRGEEISLPYTPISFTHIDGSWTPAAPRANALAREAYYRPDLLSASSSNAFSLGLGWVMIVVAILCCITFLALCFRPPRSKELSSMNTEGRFRDVLIREMKSRHALVGLCNTSADSVLNLPAKFLLLFLNTFSNLALSAVWFGQHSVGEMFSSTLITATCVFILMQLMRLCLRCAHTRNEWFVPLISYTGPLVLAVWSAYTTGLYVLQMSEIEAQFFLIRAVCSFILQHTLFFTVTTTMIVLVGLRKSKTKANNADIQPLPEL